MIRSYSRQIEVTLGLLVYREEVSEDDFLNVIGSDPGVSTRDLRCRELLLQTVVGVRRYLFSGDLSLGRTTTVSHLCTLCISLHEDLVKGFKVTKPTRLHSSVPSD